MMTLFPKQGEGRLLAIALLSIAMILLYMLIHYTVVLPHHELNSELDELTEAYAGFHAVAMQQTRLEATIVEWHEAQRNNRDDFLSQEDFELAAADLQDRLKERLWHHAGSERRCGIVSLQNVLARKETRFIKVTVKVRLNCGLPELQAFIYDLEAEKPVLMLDNFSIQGHKQSRRNKHNKSILDARFDVIAYLRPQIQEH